MCVIIQCKSQFARYGIPDKFISENGPQFSSAVFKQFAHTYQFKHITSSPYPPRSNEMAEKGVGTAKRILEKAKEDRKDPYLAILEFRYTKKQESRSTGTEINGP